MSKVLAEKNEYTGNGKGSIAKTRFKMLSIVFILGAVGILLVIGSAYAAQVKYDVNQTIKENTVLQGEIENLNVSIKKSTNIAVVEQRAKDELGMIYPGNDQYVYLGEKNQPQGAMAMLIKDRAYN